MSVRLGNWRACSSHKLRYEYDKLGQLSHCRLPGGQLSSIDLNGSRLTSHQFSADREQQRQQGLLLSQYQYDEQGRLQAHSVSQQQHGQHHNLYRRAYAYDANGNLAGIDDSRKGNLRYHYDPLDRLINVRVPHQRASPTTRPATCSARVTSPPPTWPTSKATAC